MNNLKLRDQYFLHNRLEHISVEHISGVFTWLVLSFEHISGIVRRLIISRTFLLIMEICSYNLFFSFLCIIVAKTYAIIIHI